MPPLFISDLAIPRLEADLENEFASQGREVEWIAAAAGELAPRVNEDDGVDVAAMADEARSRWETLSARWQQRLARIAEAKENSRKLGDDLRELREWIRDVEQKLNRPVSVMDTTSKEYNKKRKEYLVRTIYVP